MRLRDGHSGDGETCGGQQQQVQAAGQPCGRPAQQQQQQQQQNQLKSRTMMG